MELHKPHTDIEAIRRYYSNKLAATVEVMAVRNAIESGRVNFTLLDAREPADFAEAHIPGAVNIPPKGSEEKIKALDPAADYIVYCYSHH